MQNDDHHHDPSKATTAILERIALDCAEGEEIALGEFMHRLTDRAFGFGILLFALPNCLPIGIPGISSVCAVPIIFFAAQMMMGYDELRLPKWAARKRLPQQSLSKAILKMLPYMRRLEKLIRPRMTYVVSPKTERWIGALIVYHAVIMFLPLPGANAPSAIAIALLALALLENDGLLGTVALIYALVSAVFMSALWFTIFSEAPAFLMGLF